MNTELLIPLLTVGGTLLLVVTGLLNFSVFVRQLRAARDQLETAQHNNYGQAFDSAILKTSASRKMCLSRVRPEFQGAIACRRESQNRRPDPQVLLWSCRCRPPCSSCCLLFLIYVICVICGRFLCGLFL